LVNLQISGGVTPQGGTFSGSGVNGLIFNPAVAGVGTHKITYTFTDGNGCTNSASQDVVVEPTNAAPTLQVPGDQMVNEGSSLFVDIVGFDSDAGSKDVKVTLSTSFGKLTLSTLSGLNFSNGDGSNDKNMMFTGSLAEVNAAMNNLKYKPNDGFVGNDQINIILNDQGNTGCDGDKEAIKVIRITVKDVLTAPVAKADKAITVEDSSVVIAVLDNDTFTEGSGLVVSSVTQPNYGTATVNGDGKTVTYRPNPNFFGTDNFSYTADDGAGGTASELVTVVVKPVNDNPVAVDDAGSTTQDSSATIAVLDNDSDVDGDSLTVVSVSSSNDGTAVINSDNTVTFTPNANFLGSTTLTYEVSDGRGGLGLFFDGKDDFVSTTLDVQPNALPSTTWEAWVLPVCLPDGGRQVILSGASDNLGRAVTIESASSDSANFGVFTGNGVWQPVGVSINQWQHIAVVYSASGIQFYKNGEKFEFGNAPGNQTSSATFNFGRTPAGGDFFPGCLDDIRVWESERSQSEIIANMNKELVGNENDLVAYWKLNDGSGDTALNARGTGNNGLLGGGEDSEKPQWVDSTAPVTNYDNAVSANIVITVTESANGAPVAVADAGTTDEDSPVTLNVLANDSDPDGDSFLISSATKPNHATVKINDDNTITYMPELNYFGDDKFDYIIKDSNDKTAIATVTMTINPVNDAPTAAKDTVGTVLSTMVVIPVLFNDNDAEAEPLTVVDVTDPANGNVAVTNEQTIEYTPDGGYLGPDTFEYTIEDAEGARASSSVYVLVSNSGESPTVENLPDLTINEDDKAVLSLDDFVSDSNHGPDEIRWRATILQDGSEVATTNIKPFENGRKDNKELGAFKPGLKRESELVKQYLVFNRYENSDLLTDSLSVTIDGERNATFFGAPDYFTNKPVAIIMTATDPAGLSGSDTLIFKINGVNDQPAAFSRISPIDDETLQPSLIRFSWTQSTDADGDQINYTLNLEAGEIDTSIILQDTTLTFDLSSVSLSGGSVTVTWSVWSSDGSSVTTATNGFGAFVFDVATSVETSDVTPGEFALLGNYPNPFNPTTQIRYQLPEFAVVKIEIYNLNGRRIRTLINESQAAGIHNTTWDARDEIGRLVPSGVYVYRLVAGRFKQVRKMLLVK